MTQTIPPSDSSRPHVALAGHPAAYLLVAGVASLAAAAIFMTRGSAPRRQRVSFRDRRVLITGGARGLGLALARRLAGEGATLVLMSRTRAELDHAAEELRRQGARDVEVIVCDVRDRAAVDAAVHDIESRLGPIDVLVNNAGVIVSAPFEHTQPGDFEDSLATHLWGPLHLIRACVPHMKRRGGGRIVNIASVGGRVGVPHLSAYSTGKFALVGLSETLRAELAKDGIQITTVAPWLMRTGSHRDAIVRGQHRHEAQWFSLAAGTKATAIDPDRAARTILDACREGRATVAPGWPSRLAHVVDALAPDAMADVMAVASNLALPGTSDAPDANQARRSRDLDLGLVEKLVGG
jgi:NAD(P)-dependent dehydrogenase (short-subunit alcohol dehydrogenase family)